MVGWVDEPMMNRLGISQLWLNLFTTESRGLAPTRAALVVSTGSTGTGWRRPDVRRAHGLANLHQLFVDELDARDLIRPPPIVGHARRRQAPHIADMRIEVDRLICLGQILRLSGQSHVTREIRGNEVTVLRAPARHAGRRSHAHRGTERAAFEASRPG